MPYDIPAVTAILATDRSGSLYAVIEFASISFAAPGRVSGLLFIIRCAASPQQAAWLRQGLYMIDTAMPGAIRDAYQAGRPAPAYVARHAAVAHRMRARTYYAGRRAAVGTQHMPRYGR